MQNRFLLTGHVDHGKSTLGGQLLYQTGFLNEREVQKIFHQAEEDKMYSFRWARLLDVDNDEREKGVTIEYNEIEFNYQDKNYKLIDTPGHKLYIRYLIEAIYRNTVESNVVGVLVLSSIPNELEAAMSSGQVKEDIFLLRAIGINSIIVAVNKLDRSNWSRESFETTVNRIKPILKSARFGHIGFVACSGIEGKGIVNKEFDDIPSLIELIDKFHDGKVLSIKETSDEVIETNIIKADIYILNCNIFSAGYSGILHTKDGEFSFSVEVVNKISKVKNNNPFVKSGDRANATLVLDEKIKIKNGDRIVLRSSDHTIAYGRIIV